MKISKIERQPAKAIFYVKDLDVAGITEKLTSPRVKAQLYDLSTENGCAVGTCPNWGLAFLAMRARQGFAHLA